MKETGGEENDAEKSILKTEKKSDHGSLNVSSAFDDLFIEYHIQRLISFRHHSWCMRIQQAALGSSANTKHSSSLNNLFCCCCCLFHLFSWCCCCCRRTPYNFETNLIGVFHSSNSLNGFNDAVEKERIHIYQTKSGDNLFIWKLTSQTFDLI